MQTAGNRLAINSQEPKSDYAERRQCVRQKIHIPAYANISGKSSGMVLDLSEILDISERGMCVQTATALPRNLRLPVVLDLAETKAYLHTTGTVVWSDSSGRTGISFPEMPGESRRQLKEWLFANAIAACVNHVEASAPEMDDEMLDRAGHVRASESNSDDEYDAPLRPDYTSILIALAAVKREVDSTGRDLEKAFQLIADRALTFTRASGAAIVLADKSNWDDIVCLGRAGVDAPPFGAHLDIKSNFSGACVRTGKLLRCEDSETDSRVDRENCRSLGIRSMVAVPVRNEDRVLGLLEVFSPQPGAFIGNDDMVLQRLAEMVANAIRNAAPVSPVKVTSVKQRPLTNPVSRDRASVTPLSVNPAPRISDSPQSGFLNLGLSSANSTPIARPSSGSGSPVEPATPWLGKVLLMASAATLLIAMIWVATPWVKGRMNASTPTRPQPVSSPNNTAVKGPVRPRPSASDPQTMEHLAEQGDPVAEFEMGARYATGEAVPQDYSQALAWFSKAAEQGNVPAQATLGAYYWAGRGVPQDLGKAYYWAILAQAGGDEGSKYRVALLASRLTRSQILVEQKRADDWIKAHQSFARAPARSSNSDR